VISWFQDLLSNSNSCRYSLDYGVKPLKLGEYDVRVNLWDMAGSPEYLEVRNEFYKDAQGVVLAFDVGDRGSFERLGGAEYKWNPADP
jgi:GTPase SAR1 family protein